MQAENMKVVNPVNHITVFHSIKDRHESNGLYAHCWGISFHFLWQYIQCIDKVNVLCFLVCMCVLGWGWGRGGGERERETETERGGGGRIKILQGYEGNDF